MQLLEFVSVVSPSSRIDRSNAVIRGVKIIGTVSRNGRRYLPEALKRAIGLYEGAKVNVDHPKGDPRSPRSYGDRIGSIKNVQARTDGLYGDLHFNPKHDVAEQFLWDAQHCPGNVGLSHNIQAKTRNERGVMVIEEIKTVTSVDLVADPATTAGLYESQLAESQRPRELTEGSFLALLQGGPKLSTEERKSFVEELRK